MIVRPWGPYRTRHRGTRRRSLASERRADMRSRRLDAFMVLLEEQGVLPAGSSGDLGPAAHARDEHVQYFKAGDEIIQVAINRISAEELKRLEKEGARAQRQAALPNDSEASVDDGRGKAAPLPASSRKKRRSTPERRPTNDRAEETRSRLLNATIKLLESKGFSRFRVADAVAIAGVSRGAQTHHFATKDELIEAAIGELFEKAVETAHNERKTMPEGDLLERAAEHVAAFIQGDLYKVSLHLLISAGFAEHFADGVRAISARSRGTLDQLWIDRFVNSGASVPHAEEAFGILSNSLRGLLIQERIGDEAGDSDAVKALTLKLVKRHLSPAK